MSALRPCGAAFPPGSPAGRAPLPQPGRRALRSPPAAGLPRVLYSVLSLSKPFLPRFLPPPFLRPAAAAAGSWYLPCPGQTAFLPGPQGPRASARPRACRTFQRWRVSPPVPSAGPLPPQTPRRAWPHPWVPPPFPAALPGQASGLALCCPGRSSPSARPSPAAPAVPGAEALPARFWHSGASAALRLLQAFLPGAQAAPAVPASSRAVPVLPAPAFLQALRAVPAPFPGRAARAAPQPQAAVRPAAAAKSPVPGRPWASAPAPDPLLLPAGHPRPEAPRRWAFPAGCPPVPLPRAGVYCVQTGRAAFSASAAHRPAGSSRPEHSPPWW